MTGPGDGSGVIPERSRNCRFGRVWLLTEDWPPKLGGLARWASNTAEALRLAGADVTVFAKKSDEAPSAPAPRLVRVQGHDFPRFGRFHFRRAIRGETRSEPPPDLLLCSTWNVAEGALSARIGVPVVCCVHGREVFERKGFLAAVRRRSVLEGSGLVAAASRFTAGGASSLAPGATIHVGINGVDTSLFTPDGPRLPGSHGIQLASAGRMVPRKRFDLVLDALRTVLSKGIDAGLWIAGRGPLEEELRHSSADLGDRVRFLGEVSDDELASLYRSADLFVSPCQSDTASGDVEGFGLTFVEASACGTAVAGLAEGGVTDAVEDGVSGILTDRAGFCDGVAALCSDPQRLASFGLRGRERAARLFDVHGVVRDLMDAVPV